MHYHAQHVSVLCVPHIRIDTRTRTTWALTNLYRTILPVFCHRGRPFVGLPRAGAEGDRERERQREQTETDRGRETHTEPGSQGAGEPERERARARARERGRGSPGLWRARQRRCPRLCLRWVKSQSQSQRASTVRRNRQRQGVQPASKLRGAPTETRKIHQ